MSPVRALVAAPEGVALEAGGAWWAAERLGLVEAIRYLSEGKVVWRRTDRGEAWSRPRRNPARRVPS